ncbi:MAG: hypothetical protein K2P99_01900 [Burkholderiales bacterium]|nr:hypothetical protein [Burkholderiales bacterium]
MRKCCFYSSILLLVLNSCGDGNATKNSASSYYSASNDTYYQLESSVNNNIESFVLNLVTNSGPITGIPLSQTTPNHYTFIGLGGTGNVALNNGNLGISFTSTSNNWIDFATQNTTSTQIPSGVYTTICDRTNISPCVINIQNNQITINEYSTSGVATTLCHNVSINNVNNSINPFISSFVCSVGGGAKSGIWYVMPLAINTMTALMISEYNPTINANDDTTDEIAFPQNSIAILPSGTYNYLYANLNGTNGISSAQFSNSSILNSTIGSCAGAACAIIQGKFYNFTMSGFDYFNVNGFNNYNFVGNNLMNIYQDSYIGFYY